MRSIGTIFLLLLLAACQPPTDKEKSTATEDPTVEVSQITIPTFSAVEKIADGFQFLEGPIWDQPNQRLLFSEVMANKIHQWTAAAGVQTFMEPSNYAGGNVFDLEGNIISCQGGARQLALITPDQTTSVLVNQFDGKKFNSPNDAIVKSDGTIWFTDPDYGLLAAFGEKAAEHRELDAYHIFCFNPKTNQLVSVNSNLSKPNGLVFSKDEQQLFVGNSEIGDRRLVVFDVNSNNTLTNQKTIAQVESETWGIDGLKLGTDDLLYAACGDGVNIFSQEGQLQGKIKTDFEVTNLCFGGVNGKTLFMTGHEGLYQVRIQ